MSPIFTGAYRAACGRAFALAVGLSLGLAGCSTATRVGSQLPGIGLPAGAPARPVAATHQYPAVHDMPPERAAAPLSDVEQVRLENELQSARDRLEGKPGPAKMPAKPKPFDIKSGGASGAAAKP